MKQHMSHCGSDTRSYRAEGFSWARTLFANGASWADLLRKEYYDGDIESLSADGKLDLVAHRGMSLPYPVTLVTSLYRYAFCRSWSHIRENKEDLIEIRYVTRGSFALTQLGKTYTVNPGQFVFTRSRVPFRWESLSSDHTPTEYFFILLPPDFVYLHLPEGIPLDTCLAARPNQCLAMPTLFSLLYKQGAYLSLDIVNLLVTVLLKEAGETVMDLGIQKEPRKSICDKRIEDIIAYIGLHLSNPDISLLTVAQACGISPRYLCYLFKLKGTSFSALLWEERLKHAREWLITLDSKHYTISEIAFMSGFKTAAHFSRLFGNRFGCSPREFRIRNAERGEAERLGTWMSDGLAPTNHPEVNHGTGQASGAKETLELLAGVQGATGAGNIDGRLWPN